MRTTYFLNISLALDPCTLLLRLSLISQTNWYLNIDDGLANAILFIDLKKTFDTFDHARDYLSDRTQVTVIAFVEERVHNAVEIADFLEFLDGYSSLQIWPSPKNSSGANSSGANDVITFRSCACFPSRIGLLVSPV